MADALYAVKKLVYDENKITMHDLKMALSTNYGKGLSNEDVARDGIRGCFCNEICRTAGR